MKVEGSRVKAESAGPVQRPKRTPLYPVHRRLGAKMVEFAGWEMPVQYRGVIEEHLAVRSRAGLSEGGLVEASFHRGKIILTPKLVIDRSKFPNADDEYTPEQRRIIDARLAESAEDIKRGRVYSFETHEDMIKFLHSRAQKARRKNNIKSSSG